jgi:hypothetical protein
MSILEKFILATSIAAARVAIPKIKHIYFSAWLFMHEHF